MLAHNYKEVFSDLNPIAEQMVIETNALPAEMQKWTAHINRLGAISQYIYYTALVKQYISDESAYILDWGACYGQVAHLLNYYFKNVHCYDPLPDDQLALLSGFDPYCDDFKSLFDIPECHRFYGVGNATIINRSDASYDAVISSGVFEHVREDYGGCSEGAALREVYRILKPSGLFFIWNLPSSLGAVELLNTALGRKVHTCTYFKREIIELLKSVGFEVVALDHHEFLNMMLRNLLGKIIGHNKAWRVDYILSKIPPFSIFAQHFTIVAKKSAH